MQTIKLSRIFSSVTSSEFAYDELVQPYVKRNGVKASVLVLPQFIPNEELEGFSKFLEALGINIEDVSNYGYASFENDEFKNHSPVFLGKNEDGKLVIKIGGDYDTKTTSSIYVECVEEKVQKKAGKKVIDAIDYTFNGCSLKVEERTVIDEVTKAVKSSYIESVLSYTDDEMNDFEFIIPTLFDRKQFENDAIVKAFKTGNLANVIRSFNSGNGSKVFAAANKMFTDLFTSKNFPTDGVFLVVTDGRLRVTPAGTVAGIDYDMVSADWEIIGSSHPELLVKQSTKKGEEPKYCALNEVTTISFSSAANNNEGYNWLVKNRIEIGMSYKGVCLIKIVRPANNPQHMPVNICTNNAMMVNRLLPAKHKSLLQHFEQSALPFDISDSTATPASNRLSYAERTMIFDNDTMLEEVEGKTPVVSIADEDDF